MTIHDTAMQAAQSPQHAQEITPSARPHVSIPDAPATAQELTRKPASALVLRPSPIDWDSIDPTEFAIDPDRPNTVLYLPVGKPCPPEVMHAGDYVVFAPANPTAPIPQYAIEYPQGSGKFIELGTVDAYTVPNDIYLRLTGKKGNRPEGLTAGTPLEELLRYQVKTLQEQIAENTRAGGPESQQFVGHLKGEVSRLEAKIKELESGEHQQMQALRYRVEELENQLAQTHGHHDTAETIGDQEKTHPSRQRLGEQEPPSPQEGKPKKS